MRFFHIGITVNDIQKARTFFIEGLDCSLITERNLTGEYLGQVLGKTNIQSAKIAMLEFKGGPTLELVEYDTVFDKHYESIQYDGVHHLAHFVADIDEVVERLLRLGSTILGNRDVRIPAGPYSNCRIVFLKAPFNLTLELIEKSDL